MVEEQQRRRSRRGGSVAFRNRPTVYPRATIRQRNVCSGKRGTRDAAHVPNAERQLSRAPRGRELYTSGRRASIGRALALARFSGSPPPPPPPPICFLVLLRLSLSLSLSLSSPLLSARFRASLPSSPPSPTTGRERDSDRDRDRDRTDWINRKPRRLQVTDRHPFRERTRATLGSRHVDPFPLEIIPYE